MRVLVVLIAVALFSSCRESRRTSASPVKSAPTFQTSPDSALMDSLERISNTFTKEDRKRYPLEEVYREYVDSALLDYLAKNHPTWSIPGNNMWYPELFKKYKTEGSLVNYVPADFNGDGLKDYALLLHQEKDTFRVVAFLRDGNSFKTEELSRIIHQSDRGYDSHYGINSKRRRMEWHIRIFKPGKYNITDVDIEVEDRRTVLTLPGIGVGLFQELYDGSMNVHCWMERGFHSWGME